MKVDLVEWFKAVLFGLIGRRARRATGCMCCKVCLGIYHPVSAVAPPKKARMKTIERMAQSKIAALLLCSYHQWKCASNRSDLLVREWPFDLGPFVTICLFASSHECGLSFLPQRGRHKQSMSGKSSNTGLDTERKATCSRCGQPSWTITALCVAFHLLSASFHRGHQERPKHACAPWTMILS